jgi:CHAT domain-containing protein
LSYSVGEAKSFLFVVSSNPKGGPALLAYSLPVGDKALRESVEAFRRMIDRKGPSGDFVSRSRALYDLLLGPAEALIGKSDRLLIVPDGPLHILPWAALVRKGSVERPEYLVEWKPVHTVLSATVYAQLKKSRSDARSVPAIELAAFGDPRYPAYAARKTVVTRSDGTEEPEGDAGDDPAVNAVLRGGYRFDPLPRSRQEVESIASLYAPRSETFVGAQATEERATSVGKDVPLIHYACHAYVNERFPLDSALVFTIPENPKPGQANGLLQAWEIFEKVRIDADLVTLSACDSGLGKEMGGEGLIGLTRAFQYAGARSVLASLWKVEDQSTAELMKRFYSRLKAGQTKDKALRLAQIDLIRSTNFSQPRDWAAFELFGDWK